MIKLKFAKGNKNKKLNNLQLITGQKIYSFSISPGDSCKFAKDCKTFIRKTREGFRLVQKGRFKCYAACMDVRLPNLYYRNRFNLQLLKKSATHIDKCILLLYNSIPRDADIIRWHVAGDFFSWNYLRAFIEVVKKFPQIYFYCHTKAVRYVYKFQQQGEKLPPNLHISLSYGGVDDHLIPLCNLPYSKVIKNEQEAKKENLVIDRNDSYAGIGNKNVGLILHGPGLWRKK